jgi:hypothetical protein
MGDSSAGQSSKTHPPPSGSNGKLSKIHVIDVRRTLIDILAVSPEEASLAVEAAVIDLPRLRGALQALPIIAERARGLIRFLNSPIPEGQMAEITARSLFSCPAYLPLIDRGAYGPPDGTLLRVRPASFVRAIHIDGSIVAIAAEEAVDLLGVAVDPVRFAELLVDTYGGGVNRGVPSYVETGTFSPSILGSVASKLFPQPESSPSVISDEARISLEEKSRLRAYPAATMRDLERRGFTVYATPDRDAAGAVVATLLQKAHASAAYYQGAAVSFALDALTLARQGRGSSRILAIVRHSPGRLQEEIVAKKRMHASVAPPAEPPLTQEKLKYLLQRLSKTRHIAADDPNTYIYELSPLFDLFRVGAFDIYIYVLIEGRESPMLDTFLERETMAHAKETQLRRLARASVLSTALVRQYLLIVEDKLGAARLARLMQALRHMSGRGVRTLGEPWALTKTTTALVQVEDPKVVLDLLTQKERTLVLTEYENRKTEWNAQVNNKCPHVRLAKRLRTAPTTVDAEEILTELSKYFIERHRGKANPADALKGGPSAIRDFAGRDEREAEAAPQSQWLMCRNCGFRTICPHVRDRIRFEARGISYDELRTRLFKYAVRYNARAEDGQPESYTYFCRICSERLAEFIEEDRTAELMGRFGDLDSSLRSAVWVEALNAAKFVRFPAPTDPKQFASAVTNYVYPLVMLAEEATAKKSRKRALAAAAAEDEEGGVEPRTRLYAVLYIYAYILNLIQSSESSNKKGAEVGFEGVRPGAKISTYADRVLTVITDTHKGLLSQIEDITTEFIAARFKEAFRIVRGDSGDMRLKPVDAEEELANQTVVIDPIYHYAVGGAKIFGDLPPGRSTTPEKARREFETVMGDPLPTIVKASREYAKLPALAPLYSKKLVVEVPADTSLVFLYKDPRVNLYAKLYRPKTKQKDAEDVKLFHSLADAVKGIESTGLNTWVGGSQKTKHARWDDHAAPQRKSILQRPGPDLIDIERGYAIESYSLFLEYTTAITDQAAWDAYLQRLKRVRDAENGYLMLKATASLKTYYNFGFSKSRQFQRIDIPITMLYDENGDGHEWNILVFQPAGGSPDASAASKLIEIRTNTKKKDDDSVVRAIATGVIHEATLIDYKCGICGVRQTGTDSLNTERTIRSLRIASEIVSFYEFYETRCPKGGLHSFTGSKCQKCGMSEDLSADPAKRTLRNPAARTFYEQYESTFLVERRAISDPPSIPVTRPAPPDVQDPGLAKWAAEWKYDYSAIVKAAEAIDATPATIEAIGDMEKRDYAEIKKGEGARPPPETMDDPRIMAADSDVRLFVANYNMLQSAYRLPRLPQHVADILEKAGLQRHDFEILKNLPDVYDRYRPRLEALTKVQTPADILKFIIERLCLMVLALLSLDQATSQGRVAHEFAVQELRSILRSEKLLSKPGSFNFSIFTDAPDEEDLPEDVGLDGEDVLEEAAAEAGEDGVGADNPFDYQNIDYEGDVEDDPNAGNPDSDT